MTVVRDDASLIGEGYLKESHLKQHLCCYFDLTKFNLGKQDGVDVVFLCASNWDGSKYLSSSFL
jgi:hypothetical protein